MPSKSRALRGESSTARCGSFRLPTEWVVLVVVLASLVACGPGSPQAEPTVTPSSQAPSSAQTAPPQPPVTPIAGAPALMPSSTPAPAASQKTTIPSPTPVPTPLPAAEVEVLAGSIEVQRGGDGQWLPVARSSSVWPGDAIRTGTDGQASLSFADKSEVVLQAATTVMLDRFFLRTQDRSVVERLGRVVLFDGSVAFDIQPFPAGPSACRHAWARACAPHASS